MMYKNKSGFTLVELAIVLVIIGLIVGGVLVGRDLIRTAELRSVLSDIEKYQAAVNTFRGKYNALPGDFRNATAIWDAADADPADCPAALAGGVLTCNGNGNASVAGVSDPPEEAYLFWQHLGNAALIGFSSTGTVADGFVLGSTIPTSTSMTDIGYIGATMGTSAGDDEVYAGNYGNVFLLFSAAGLQILSPADAKWLDEKKDDGLPGTGSVASYKGGGAPATNNPDCATTAVASTAEYDLSVNTAECTLLFKKAF